MSLRQAAFSLLKLLLSVHGQALDVWDHAGTRAVSEQQRTSWRSSCVAQEAGSEQTLDLPQLVK